MNKKVQFIEKPKPVAPQADDWVNGRRPIAEPTKRLSLIIPEWLHRNIKTSCVKRGVKMLDEIRELLVKKYDEK